MISIIIPVFNEEKRLPGLLKYLENASSGLITEIIIVDGGSTDATLSVIPENNPIISIGSDKGRAIQMNTGARIARAETLYFLHADSFPPDGFDRLIVQEIKKGNKAGCFRMKFDKDHWWLNLMGWFTRINHISCRGGDQSLFIEKQLFESMDGFNESFRVYEDNEIIKRLYSRKEFTVIKNCLTTSARLYEKLGIWNTQLLFAEIHWKRRMGASAQELYTHYHRRVNF